MYDMNYFTAACSSLRVQNCLPMPCMFCYTGESLTYAVKIFTAICSQCSAVLYSLPVLW